MRYDVPLPSLGADMEEAKLMEWKIAPGEEIKKGQTIAIVETTKSTVEIESFHSGKVLELIGKIGEVIHVGSTIATFDVVDSVISVAASRIKISPAAKRLAEEKNIKWDNLHGSGSDGQIELKDIEALVQKPIVSESFINIRSAIAKAMSRSKKEIPHYYLKKRINLNNLMNWIDQKNLSLSAEQRLMVPVVQMKAVIMALKDFPALNGYFENNDFSAKDSVNMGVAIAMKSGGVIVPAILDSQKLKLDELNFAFVNLVKRTQSNELKNRELTEGTVTVTNMGDFGADEVFGVIFPPQVAIIGIGKIHQAPEVVGQDILRSWVCDVTLSADHRVSDGLIGAKFLLRVSELLNEPQHLEQ
jgi:pyruvate dehydrogenase E2 component (dihydrolipoamide acetyltransferase)